jgi:hypothetical protein
MRSDVYPLVMQSSAQQCGSGFVVKAPLPMASRDGAYSPIWAVEAGKNRKFGRHIDALCARKAVEALFDRKYATVREKIITSLFEW